MNSNEIFKVIEQIAAESGKNEKVAIIKQHIDDSEFKRVLVAALDPLTTYGLAARPTIGGQGSNVFDEITWGMLDALSGRTLTGDAAIVAVRNVMDAMHPQSAELLWRIIAKDLRAGFGESTVNKAKSGTIRDFPYMRCSLPKAAKWDTFTWKEGVFVQEKADGMFANVDKQGDEIRITSRQGTPFPLDGFRPLVAQMRAKLNDNCQYHGEMLVYQDGVCLPREQSNGIMNSLASGGTLETGQVVHFFVWDEVPLKAAVSKGSWKEPYSLRFDSLSSAISEVRADAVLHVIPTRIVHDLKDAYAYYRELLKEGKEGVIVKNGSAIWKDGTSKEQIKLKLEVDVDLKIVGINEGAAGTRVEGRPAAFSCITSCGGLLVDVTIKNEALREKVESNPQDFLERVVVVRANSIMPPSESNEFHSLFLPRMAEESYRADKTEADSLQRVKEQFEAAVAA